MKFKFFYFILAIFSIFRISYAQTITTVADMLHVTCSGSTGGAITLNNTTGGTAPYTYTWQPGNTNGNSISSKGYGNYTVTIKGTGATINTYTYNILYRALWQDFYPGMTTNPAGNILIQNRSDMASTWLETANTANILSASTDGWIEYVAQSAGLHKMFGLLDSASGTGYADIDFGVYLQPGGFVKSFTKGTKSAIGSYPVVDFFRFERVSNKVTIRKNGSSVWTTTITPAMVASRLTARAALYAYGTQLENLGCSFPAANISAGSTKTITCSSPTVNLVGSTNVLGGTYSWTPGGSAANSLTTSVTAAGTYSLKITVPLLGCTATSTVSVVTNTTLPSPTASTTGTLTCATTTVALNGGLSAFTTYTWSGAGFSGGVNSNNAIATAPGIYTLTVTKTTNGCINSATTAVTQNTTLPSPTASTTGTLTCTSTTVALNGGPSSGVTYTWTGPGFSGGTNSQNTVGTAVGTYTLKVTSTTNGCINSATTAVTQNTTLPSPTASTTGTLTCTTTTVALNGGPSSGVTYTWTGPGFSGGTNLQNAVGTAVGTYTLKVTSTTNGCVNSATTAVTQNTALPSPTASTTGTLTCTTTTVALNGGPSGGVTYTWTGPGFSGGTNSQNAVGTAVGTYTLKVTSTTNGCVNSATTAVTQNTALPSPTASTTGTLTCTTTTVALNGGPSSGVTYTWTGPGFSGGVNSQNAIATAGGTYTLTVKNTANGCVNSATTAVTQFTDLPIPTATTTGTLTCTTLTVALNGGPARYVTYNWTGPGFSGSTTTKDAIATAAGIYTLTITSTTNGCVNSATTAVTQNTIAPTITISNPIVVLCYGNTTTLTATGAVSYTWSTASVSNSIIVSPTVTTTYSLTGTGSNGCVGTASSSVTASNLIAEAGPATFVSLNSSVNLGGSPSAFGGSGNYSYSWSPSFSYTPSSSIANPTITAGSSVDFTLTVTDQTTGCIRRDVKLVYIIDVPYYFVLKKNQDAGFYQSYNSTIYFAFEEEYYDVNAGLNYKIVDDNNVVVTSITSQIESIGDNRYQLNLSTLGLTVGKYYRIAIFNERNETWHARFKY